MRFTIYNRMLCAIIKNNGISKHTGKKGVWLNNERTADDNKGVTGRPGYKTKGNSRISGRVTADLFQLGKRAPRDTDLGGDETL